MQSNNKTILEIKKKVKVMGNKAQYKVPKDKAFEAIDGSEIRDLITLADTLESMSDDSYYYHVEAQRNDFSNWVRDCLGETELATKMECSDNREQVVIHILRFVIAALKH